MGKRKEKERQRKERKNERDKHQHSATELWRSGYSIDELAPIFGKNRSTILGWIRKVNGSSERTPEEAALAFDRKEDKRKNTLLERYGVTSTMACPEILNKSKNTLLERYGVDNIFKSMDVIQQRRMTCLDRYGVDHPMKTTVISSKSHKNRKQNKVYTFGSGKQVRTQGHGDLALKILEDMGFVDSDIVTKHFSDVRYFNQKKNDWSTHIFDIYIKSKNLVIEVKGTHPVYGWPADKDNTISKMLAAINMGYNYQVWVFSKKQLSEVFTLIHNILQN